MQNKLRNWLNVIVTFRHLGENRVCIAKTQNIAEYSNYFGPDARNPYDYGKIKRPTYAQRKIVNNAVKVDGCVQEGAYDSDLSHMIMLIA